MITRSIKKNPLPVSAPADQLNIDMLGAMGGASQQADARAASVDVCESVPLVSNQAPTTVEPACDVNASLVDFGAQSNEPIALSVGEIIERARQQGAVPRRLFATNPIDLNNGDMSASAAPLPSAAPLTMPPVNKVQLHELDISELEAEISRQEKLLAENKRAKLLQRLNNLRVQNENEIVNSEAATDRSAGANSARSINSIESADRMRMPFEPIINYRREIVRLDEVKPLLDMFTGDDAIMIKPWIANFESAMASVNANGSDYLRLARQMLGGSAKIFLRRIGMTATWDIFCEKMIEEFHERTI